MRSPLSKYIKYEENWQLKYLFFELKLWKLHGILKSKNCKLWTIFCSYTVLEFCRWIALLSVAIWDCTGKGDYKQCSRSWGDDRKLQETITAPGTFAEHDQKSWMDKEKVKMVIKKWDNVLDGQKGQNIWHKYEYNLKQKVQTWSNNRKDLILELQYQCIKRSCKPCYSRTLPGNLAEPVVVVEKEQRGQ